MFEFWRTLDKLSKGYLVAGSLLLVVPLCLSWLGYIGRKEYFSFSIGFFACFLLDEFLFVPMRDDMARHLKAVKGWLAKLSGSTAIPTCTAEELRESMGKEIALIEKERKANKFSVFRAATTKLSGDLEAWKDASGDMARLAFECGKEGPKKRTRNDLNNLCKRLNIELTPGQLEEVRKTLPDEYVDRQNRAGISR